MKRDKQSLARPFPSPPVHLDLELLPRPGVEESEAKRALYSAVRASWLLLHLGGIGTRARRLGGALAHCPSQGRTLSHLGLPFALSQDPQEAAEQLGAALTQLRKRLWNDVATPDQPANSLWHPLHPVQGQLGSPAQANPLRPNWEVLDSQWCSIWVFSTPEWRMSDPGWSEAADTIGSWLRETRRQLALDERMIFVAPLVIPQERRSINPPRTTTVGTAHPRRFGLR